MLEKICLVCVSISANTTFTSEACQESKNNSVVVLTIIKVTIECLGKFLRKVFKLTVVLMATVELMIENFLFLNNVKHKSS